MKSKINYYKIFKYSLIPITLLLILTFILNYFNLLPAFWKSIYVFYFALIFDTVFVALKIKMIPKDKRDKYSIIYLSRYFFLLLLIVLAINQFLKRQIIIDNLSYLISVSIALGFLTFYSSKERIEQVLEEEKINEETIEKKKNVEFEYKFPKVNKILGLRSIVKWMYKEGWGYSIGLLVIVLLSVSLIFYNLGAYEIRADEFLMVDVATGFLYTGDFYKWDWIQNKSGQFTECIENDKFCHYTRAWPHTFLTAQSYKLFGISEWSSRFVSAIFGLIFIVFSYFFFKFFTESKKTALLIVFIFSFYPPYLEMFRNARMYALLAPIFIILCFIIFLALTKRNKIKGISKYLDYVNYKFVYIIMAGVTLILAYLIHINSLVILPASALFVLYLAITKREKRYIFLTGFVIILALFAWYLLNYTNVLSNISSFISFFGGYNKIYLDYLIAYPLGISTSIVLASFLFIFAIFNKNNNLKNKLVFLVMLVLFSLGFFVYIADRYHSFLYISHITPISIGIILFSFTILTKVYNKKTINYLLTILIIVAVLFSFYGSFDRIYKNDTSYGKFKIAYSTIENNYKDGEVIFGQYLRNYYLQNLPNDVTVINMLNNNLYTYQQFSQDLKKYDSGWITWETKKGYHLQNNIKNFISKNFKKVHGSGIDNTNVEIYYFDKGMKRP